MIARDASRRLGLRTAVWLLVLVLSLGAALLWSPMTFGQNGDDLGPPAKQARPLADRPFVGIDPDTGELAKIITLFRFSIYINSAIAVLSVIALMLFLFFLLTISSSAMSPPSFVDDVTNLVQSRRYEDVANFCRAHRRVFVATIIQRCAENAGKTHSVIMEMLDAEGRRRADLLWNRISYLADVSNVAPMLGLLGTVHGMIKAFFSLPEGSDSINSRVLSTAIGGAMSTTMFGLIVAIAALVFYTIIKSRATRALADAEQAVHSIADRIKRGGE